MNGKLNGFSTLTLFYFCIPKFTNVIYVYVRKIKIKKVKKYIYLIKIYQNIKKVIKKKKKLPQIH